jgi:hypothetical protein
MTRIIQKHPRLATRSLSRLVFAVLVALLLATSAADAALTTGACLAQKRVAWGTLRKCQATEEAKQLKGKPADLAQCLTKLQTALAKITAKATKAKIPCRYLDNGDLTITDYDNGLQWEKLTDDGSLLDKDILFTWGNLSGCAFTGCPNGTAFIDLLGHFNNCVNTDGAPVGGFAGHCDWRLPTVEELQTIVDMSVPGCATASPCIDPIFGSTVANFYSSATTDATDPDYVWGVTFYNGNVNDFGLKVNGHYVRAVRTGS